MIQLMISASDIQLSVVPLYICKHSTVAAGIEMYV